MKKFALCSIISLCCIANLFSVSSYVIPTDSEFYSVIDLLYVLESEALPNTSRPWSEAQAKKALSYLEKMESMKRTRIYFLKRSKCWMLKLSIGA